MQVLGRSGTSQALKRGIVAGLQIYCLERRYVYLYAFASM